MRRRDVLAGAGLAGLSGLAGCAGFQLTSTESSNAPPLVENRPDGVYIPTHVEGMKMAGVQQQGNYECALTYTYPHRFWLLTGTHRQQVKIKNEDTVHLMPVVWDTNGNVAPPDVNPQVSIAKDGESVANVSPWPMLSQPMGFHFGDNVALAGDGTYRLSVHVGEPSVRRTGALADVRYGSQTFEFDFEFSESELNEISYRDVPKNEQGSRGALDPMGMKTVAMTQAPAVDELPGSVRGTGTNDDATFVVTTVEDAEPYGGSADQTYLAVSPRTPYNRYILPAMSLSATLTRNGETVFDGSLNAALGPGLNYHYGTLVSRVESGDGLTVSVEAPPQTARHEGYETAFLQMEKISLTI